MPIEAGKLRHRIQIQRQIQQRDPETGAVNIKWSNHATVWAAVEPVSVREFISAQAKQSEIVARVVIRARDDLVPQMRILFRGKVYNPEGWLPDPDSGLEYMTAPVSEGVNDGQ